MTVADAMPDILSPEFAVNPHPYYKIMRDHYPLVHHEASGYYFLTRFADVEHRRIAILGGAFSDVEEFLWQFRKGAFTGDKRRQRVEITAAGRFLRKAMGAALAEIARVTRPGGCVLLQDFRHTAEYAEALP